MPEHVLHLAILALPDREGEPNVAALGAVERGRDGTITDAVEGDAGAQAVEVTLPYAAVRAHAITAQPAGRRQLERARKRAVVGQQQQALGVEVEAADADETRQPRRQGAEDRRTAAGVSVRRQQAARLVVKEEPRALAHGQRLPVDRDAVVGRDIARGRGDDRAVDRHPPGGDPRLGFAARTQPRPRDRLGDALAGRWTLVLPAHMPHGWARCSSRGVIADQGPLISSQIRVSHRQSVISGSPNIF